MMSPVSLSSLNPMLHDHDDEQVVSPLLRGAESDLWGQDDSSGEEAYPMFRRLEEARGQAVLTFMYLCVLGICFMTAVVYFCRMQWEERFLRRLRENELSAIRSAMVQSENTQRDESRAVQRKYIEERRARILQLFAPVRMTLEPQNFSVEQNAKPKTAVDDIGEKGTMDKDARKKDAERDIERPSSADAVEDEDDSLLVEIPAPGLHLSLGPNEKPPNRLVSGMCTICLCVFETGSDVVWSSNELCGHVFHEDCIEKWLMKERQGPLCPCCRRDFIVDPYDMETGEIRDFESSAAVAEMSSATNNTRLHELFVQGADDPDAEERS